MKTGILQTSNNRQYKERQEKVRGFFVWFGFALETEKWVSETSNKNQRSRDPCHVTWPEGSRDFRGPLYPNQSMVSLQFLSKPQHIYFRDIDKLILKSTWKCKGSRNIKRRTALEDPRSWFLFWQSCCKQDWGVCCSMIQSQGISEREMKAYIQTPTANQFLTKMPS